MVKQAHLLTGEVSDCNESWVETVRDARGHIARTLGKPSGCIQICVAATILDDDDTLDDRDMNVVVCDMIRPHVNLCCLDARLFPTIKEMIGIITMARLCYTSFITMMNLTQEYGDRFCCGLSPMLGDTKR